VVRYCLMAIAILALFQGYLRGDDTKVTAEIDNSQGYENQPLTGTITITHNQNDKVDVSSFLLDKKPISVEFIKDVQFEVSNPLILSIYRFQLPGKPQGLYLLPAVSVRVGDKEYQSTMSSYSVNVFSGASQPPPVQPAAQPSPSPQPAAAPPSKPASASASASAPVLRLEASVDGKSQLYPGQRTKFVYRYFYSASIELVTETLPLLDAKGFIKIGEKEFKDYTQGDLTVSEISQLVEAEKPGDFSFGPSLIEGYAYQEDPYGKHVRTSAKLSSEAPAVTVAVLPFPEKDKPASFNGAVGQYQFKVGFLSPATITAGDEISLSLEITGKGNIKSVPLPNLCCQPGFSGFFQTSDLPPDEKVEGNTKSAVVKLRALTADIKEIPSVEFSFFDPETSQYAVLRSPPIPITVNPAKSPPPENLDQAKQPANAPTLKEAKVFPPVPIEIEGIIPLASSDLHNKIFGTWWSLAVLPIGIALILYQMYLHSYLLKRRSEVKRETSSEVLNLAFAQKEGSSDYFELIGKALKLALAEKHFISSADIAAEDIPPSGLAAEVRAFLSGIEEKRFSGTIKPDFAAIRSQATSLLAKIQESKETAGEAS
jgi:hypothetical protein